MDLSVERFAESPLTALARFKTRVPARTELIVKGQDGEDLQKSFSEYKTAHEIPILGLYPDFKNKVVLTSTSIDGTTSVDTLELQTRPLSRRIPVPKVLRSEPEHIESGFILVLLNREYLGSKEESMLIAIDRHGKVRWTYEGTYIFLAKTMGNGKILLLEPSVLDSFRRFYHTAIECLLAYVGCYSAMDSLYWNKEFQDPDSPHAEENGQLAGFRKWVVDCLPLKWKAYNTLREIDFLGREGRMWNADSFSFHHDFAQAPSGNLLALASTRNSEEDLLVEIGKQSNHVERIVDFKKILDYSRSPAPRHVKMNDWLHLNSLVFDDRDSSIILSARNQSAVVKLNFQTLELKWILADHDEWSRSFQNRLLSPVGGDFRWSWGQHAVTLSSEYPDRILLFDNGNQRSYSNPLPPAANFSRAVEYEIDLRNQSVSQTWQYGTERGNQLYTPVVGNAEYLPNGNRLICFGAIARDLKGNPVEWIEPKKNSVGFINKKVKSSVRIIETDSKNPATVYLELSIEDKDTSNYLGYMAYRAYNFSIY